MKTFKIKQNDQKPFLTITVKQDGDAVDLTNVSSVKFNMVTADNERTKKVNSGATISDAINGQIKYEWGTGDTDTPGEYWGEFQMTWSSGEKQTVPADDGLKIIITEDYGD